jgi:CRISPR-associated endonuclease/helicase Cas3
VKYEDFFTALTSLGQPHEWQQDLAAIEDCGNRLIRIPTGFGKTLGVVGTWLYHRLHRKDERWPRRLVWCLPTRVLVEQTMTEVSAALARLHLLWDGNSDHAGKAGVHLLMGGADVGEWHLYPEHCAVLIGTQDMLLSRAMNRGYAAPRARWPMEFGLLNHDCLWVLDEVQLMDVGLATSGQLQAFRREDSGRSLRPCCTWWMSATLQKGWLEKSPDTRSMVKALPPPVGIPENKRSGHLWTNVKKPCGRVDVKDAKELGRLVAREHVETGRGVNGPTLVVVNTVDRAVAVHEFLGKDKTLKGSDIRLVHSRFRPAERATWREEFLNRSACAPGTDRIIVATQVVEAGVDISAGLLVTELAPWASLVQRFGRCARWGGAAKVVVADLAATEAQEAVKNAREKYEKALAEGKKPKPIDEQEVADAAEERVALPYTLAEIRASREALSLLSDVAPLHLEAFEEEHAALLPRLYPFEPAHLLLRHELDELFDTTPDLSGADIDISRFIRSGEERDLHVFWAEVPEKIDPASELKPSRNALCAVPFGRARNWLCGPETASKKAPRLKEGMRAWVWDWQDGAWRSAERRDLYPGQTVLVASKCGGYDYDAKTRIGKGWDPDHTDSVAKIDAEAVPKRRKQCWKLDAEKNWAISEKEVRVYAAEQIADAAQDSEELSVSERWKTIATHGRETGREAHSIATGLVPTLAALFDLAGRWHDVGKVHPAFQASIRHETERPDRQDLAKAPDAAWPCSARQLYAISPTDRRPGFRHELASVLALFGVLQRHDPDHPALLGPWREFLNKSGLNPPFAQRQERTTEPTPLEQEILALDAERFNLLTYLICAHHGKLRLAWHAGKGDQAANDGALRIRGVREGDILPPLTLATADGNFFELPATRLDLAPAAAGLSLRTGASWTERVLGLLATHGPFTLAWLEALLRAADQRASRRRVADPLLGADNERHGLERSNSALAGAVPGGAQAASPAGDSPPRGPLHGDGRGAGGRALHSGTTRPPHSATRYVETQLGILSYRQLAPHLAERVALAEVAIGERQFASRLLDEFLLLELHRRISGDLVPAIAGRWRTREVRVGDHQPPRAFRVPILMRDYAADLAARVAHARETPDERLIETLTFAEGRLLYIHPFEDFNGRVTRLFLIELLYRLELPIVDPATDEGEETQRYFTALRAYDRRDSRPLAAVWRERFEKEIRA